VAKRHQRWINFLFRPLFNFIGYIYRIYRTNRDRVENFKAGKTISSFIRNGAIIVLLVWILIWFFASDESRVRLMQEVKESLGGL
jgi:hypothetical protein